MAGEQLQVLNALDVAKTQWYHFTAIVIAGMGFFTDAYDLFCISLVTKLLGRIYYFDASSASPGTLPPNVSAAVNGVAFCGTLSGQLFFGWLGDKLGRKKVYGMTLMMMVICSVASGLSFGHTAKGVLATLCFFRFWLGFGIGGDYPLSATIMSEYANKKTRGAFIAAVFAMQGFGILAGGIVAIVVSAAFKSRFDAPAYAVDRAGSTVPEADYIWRMILMLGALPAALTYYWRMKMPETARYTALVAKNAKQAAADMSKVLQVEIVVEQNEAATEEANSFGLFSREFARRHGLHLVGTATTWFLLDIAFYSQNLFQKDIFSAINWIPKAATMNAIEEVFRIARAQTLIALCGTVPGYWFTVAFIDIIGRFAIQIMGFFFMTVFMLGLAIPYHHWTTKGNHIGFVVVYAFTFFFANFGPNSTTFIVPAEIFPARLRSTCHGISAAAGKAGAIVGAFGFLYAAQSRDPAKRDKGYPAGIGVRNALFVLAACNLLGLVFTFLVPESKGKSLEEMSGENEAEELMESLQLLASSRSVTIVTGDGSDSRRNRVTAIIVVGALGYVFIWWKGWKLSDMMFVTRRGLSDACTRVGKQLELLSSSIAAAKRQISSRMDRVDSNLDECKELAAATKCEVSQLHGDLSLFHTEVESVHRAVQTLETKLGRIEGSQDFATRGVYQLCQFVERLEQGRNQEFLQDSPTTSHRAIELPQTSSVVARTSSLPPLAVESPSPPSASPSIALESPRILRSSTAVSASGLKELQEISNAIKPGNMKSNMMSGNTSEVSNGTTEEPNGTAPSSSRSIWKSTEEQNSAVTTITESEGTMAEEAGMIAAARASEEDKAREREADPSDEIEEGEIEDADADSDADAARRGGAQPHPLENSWTFWFDNPSAKSKQAAWGSSLRPIHTFATVEDFWSLYNNIHHPSKLIMGADFHCFKDKIEPKWEDPVCANGGKWTISCVRGKADQLWLYTLLAMIGEQFEYGDEICGAVVSVRAKQERIALWTKNAANEEAQISIGRQWKELLDYNDTIGFIFHEDAKKDKVPKNRYTV
ncbi:unnamed protein product [Musa hybrid cultivar]